MGNDIHIGASLSIFIKLHVPIHHFSSLFMKSPHILNAASNLLGICFILLTSFKIFKISRNTLYDEFIVVAILLFMGSCIFSFLALRKQDKTSDSFEKLADYMFLGGLGALFVITLLFAASII